MHHPALDRPGSHDGDLDHEIVKLLRLEAREHRHLRAALDLEHADRVRALHGLVHLRILAGDRGERLDGVERRARGIDEARVGVDELERLPDRGEHAEAEHVDLEEAELLDVVFVPRDDGSILHARRLDRRDVAERRGREHEAAHVDREVTREALERACDADDLLDARVLRIEPGLGDAGRRDAAVHVHDEAGEPVELIGREAEDLADLAERALAAIGDDLAHHRGAVAAVDSIDVLNDLLAALVLEVDVDVGRLGALGGEEAFEEQVRPRGVDGGDAEHVANRAVRRAPAALAEDPPGPREVHDLVHAEEIRRDRERLDERELLLDLRAHGGRRAALAVAHDDPLLDDAAQGVVRRFAGPNEGLARKVIVDLIERESTPRGDLDGARDPSRPVAEARGHVRARAQARLRVRRQGISGGVERRLVTNAVHDIGDGLARGVVVARPRRRDDAHAEPRLEPIGLGEATDVDRVEVPVRGHERAIAERVVERGGDGLELAADEIVDRQHGEEAGGVRDEAVERDPRRPLLVVVVRDRQHAAEVRVTRRVFDEERHARLARRTTRGSGVVAQGDVFNRDLGADDRARAALLRLGVRAHRAVEAVAIAERDGVEIELARRAHHLLGVRGALEEREAALREELGERRALLHDGSPRGAITWIGVQRPREKPFRSGRGRRRLGPDVARRGSNQAPGALLLSDVRAPPDHPRGAERRREERARQADRLEQDRRVELDVGLERAVGVAARERGLGGVLDGAREIEPRGRRRVAEPTERALEHERPRIAHAVNAVPHAHHAAAGVELGLDPRGRARRVAHGVEHVEHGSGRTAVQRALERADAGDDGGDDVAARRRDDARGERRRVHAVVGDGHEVRVEPGDGAARRRRAERHAKVILRVRGARVGRDRRQARAPPMPRGRDDARRARDGRGRIGAGRRRQVGEAGAERVHAVRRVERVAEASELRERRLSTARDRRARSAHARPRRGARRSTGARTRPRTRRGPRGTRSRSRRRRAARAHRRPR